MISEAGEAAKVWGAADKVQSRGLGSLNLHQKDWKANRSVLVGGLGFYNSPRQRKIKNGLRWEQQERDYRNTV